MSDCDRLAGAPFDAQGVAKGVTAVHINTAEALPACELALKIQPNSGRFNFQLARVYAALGRNDEAMTAYRKAVDLGHLRAGSALGYWYLNVPPTDLAQGVALLQHAAAAGDAAAIYSLGMVYFEGQGVTKDVERARGLFEAAARLGNPSSMNSLGLMFLSGEFGSANPALSRRYFEEAAARGDVYGIANLGFVYLNGIDAAKDPSRALTYFEKASELGHPGMPNEIGRLYLLGIGVPVDYSQARRWYSIGADRGDAAAALNSRRVDDLRTRRSQRRGSGGLLLRSRSSLDQSEPVDRKSAQSAQCDERQQQDGSVASTASRYRPGQRFHAGCCPSRPCAASHRQKKSQAG